MRERVGEVARALIFEARSACSFAADQVARDAGDVGWLQRRETGDLHRREFAVLLDLRWRAGEKIRSLMPLPDASIVSMTVGVMTTGSASSALPKRNRSVLSDRRMLRRLAVHIALYGYRQNRGKKEHLSMAIDPKLVTTALELPGYRIVTSLGMVRGIVVRSRSVFGTLGASLQTLVGGDITLFTSLCERTREDAYERMVQHAGERGANAVIAMRYDANEVMGGVTEVLAYGTAVVVERI